MAQKGNPLVDSINKEVGVVSGKPSEVTPVFTLEAQRKFNAFNSGLVKRSALEFVREGPTYFQPKGPKQVGHAGVPFLTSFRSKPVSELQRERAKAAVSQMGDYAPPAQFNYRQSAEEIAGVSHSTHRAAKLKKQLATLEAQDAANLSSTQKYALKEKIRKKKAEITREDADFSCQFGLESNQELRRKLAVEQQGLFDDTGLEPGDRVLVHFTRDGECWRGPYEVVRRLNATTFRVKSDQWGTIDVDGHRLQDARVAHEPPPPPLKKEFVLAVGRTTAKDVVIGLAKAAGAALCGSV